jgi:hypothetical protein
MQQNWSDKTARAKKSPPQGRSRVIFHLLENPEKIDDQTRAIHDQANANQTYQR